MLWVLQLIGCKLRALFLCVFAGIRRAACCFKKRQRSNSDSQPLTAVGVEPNQPPEVMDGWDTWGREEDPVSRQIREYRSSLAMAKQQQQQQDEPQTDFFQDMTPRITRPPRIALETSKPSAEPQPSHASMLLAAQNGPIPGGELGTWAEEEGWEAEESGWEETLREQRRQQRQRRIEEVQIRRAEHREPNRLGSRLS